MSATALRAERRCEVPTEHVAIDLDRLWPEVGPFLDPGAGIIAERYEAFGRI
jgi:hypothetical protein